jgi:hypothetical protein
VTVADSLNKRRRFVNFQKEPHTASIKVGVLFSLLEKEQRLMKRLPSSKALPVWALLTFLVVLLPLVVFLIKHVQSAYGSGTQSTTLSNNSTLAHIPTATPTSEFSAFAGRWFGHGRGLIFSSDGRAEYTARAYQWCGPGVPSPCDSFQGNNIIDGINEEMLFTYVAGNTTYGIITASSAGNAGSIVSLALGGHDTVTLTQGKDLAGILLCGPHAPVAWCGA